MISSTMRGPEEINDDLFQNLQSLLYQQQYLILVFSFFTQKIIKTNRSAETLLTW